MLPLFWQLWIKSCDQLKVRLTGKTAPFWGESAEIEKGATMSVIAEHVTRVKASEVSSASAK
jgi:hypothetical protein